MNILQINSSPRGDAADSTRLAQRIVARVQSEHPQASVVVRDVAREPVPLMDEVALAALGTPQASRSSEQQALVARFDALIAEVQAADVVVLGVPMYNFGVPAQLKQWIDAISRAQVTFRYTATGPEGLLTGKKVYLALTRGGLHRGTASDVQLPYLRTVLAFLGMSEVHAVFAEGLGMGEASVAAGLAQAHAEIDALELA